MNTSQEKNSPEGNIGDRVRSLRESNGLNQTQFAEKIGVKQGFISKVEKNNASFTIEHIILLRNIFDVDTNWLLTGEGAAPEKAANPVIDRIDTMLAEMPEEAQRDVLKYAEEKKLLRECQEELKALKAG